MKHVVIFLSLFMFSTVIAQEPIEKSIGEFTELKVYDLIEVELVKSNDNKVIISGEKTNSVVVSNRNGKLKIKMKLKEIFDGNNTKVTLYYTALDVIDANEGAKVHSKDDIKQFEIDLKAQEGATINVPLQVNYTNVKSVTGGIITTSGKSKNQKVRLLTGGVYKGEALNTEHTDVSINAAGEAHVTASELVDVKVRAGGDVYIYGRPKHINETTVLGGRVTRIK
ncbi:DUF2807 domain-containing protein [Oceanihabitans sp. IOP_32]|uniref:head GIN domain-containing protein n=1 Tax=Oceanihabitans sp. IOP_32 TaxID=2529032 RepID=UPI0012934C06|nr:head GIN domain-containing protein [Oceanihabitans sp. IOP_32]QFZ54460.1 DUF2807 domain-containing protein [Oceanihabitans sp. IOP_32]